VLLAMLELDEVLDLALRVAAERSQLVEHNLNAVVVFEELTDADVECLKDLEKGIQPDFILPLFHAGKVGLMDADFLSKLNLRQLALPSQLPDFSTDKFNLRGSVCRHFR